MDINKMKENDKSSNRLYMSFLTNNDLNDLSILNSYNAYYADSTSFVKMLYKGEDLNKFITSKEKVTDFSHLNNVIDLFATPTYQGIRPIINAENMDEFLNNFFQKTNDTAYVGGSYPTLIVNDSLAKEIKANGVYENDYYSVLINDKVQQYKVISYKNEKYVYFEKSNEFIKVTPLEWQYDKDKKILVCKDIIAGMKTGFMPDDEVSFGYFFMNNYLFKDIFKENIKSINENLAFDVIDGKLKSSSNQIELKNGKLYIHDSDEFDVNIGKDVSKIDTNLLYNFSDFALSSNPKININISGDKKLEKYSFNIYTFTSDVSIKSLNVDGKMTSDTNHIFCINKPIENVNMPCDFTLFTSLFLAEDKPYTNDKLCRNLLLNSDVTINYKDEEELIDFLKDVNRFIYLFYKDFAKSQGRIYNHIDFTYKHNLYEYMYEVGKDGWDSYKCKDYAISELKNVSTTSKIGASNLTFIGPKIDLKKINKYLMGNYCTKFEFIEKTDLKESDLINKESKNDITKENVLTKEASNILDLAREIISIDYIGVNKEDIKEKVNNIINEYNSNIKKEDETLSLFTNEGVYTNAIIKLENLKDSLYLNYEKNMNYFDIIDLINILIKMLNKIDITDDLNIYIKRVNDDDLYLSKHIIKDIETVIKVSDFIEDSMFLNIIKSYLDSEKQNIVNYLSNNGDINYKNINEFITSFRTYLVPILTKLSNDVSKKDVISSIKNYTLNEMNKNTLKNENNYITHLLSEIDKVKKDILSFNSGYVFEKLDYENLSSGKEIIDYLDKMYIKYYRVYLDLLNEKNLNENYEKSKVPNL